MTILETNLIIINLTLGVSITQLSFILIVKVKVLIQSKPEDNGGEVWLVRALKLLAREVLMAVEPVAQP